MIRVIDYTEFPIQYMGKMAGVCYGSDTFDWKKNYNRGIDVLKSNHGRVLEFPDVVLEISGYSNRVIRELYTHIVGVTRLQESTRYINMEKRFDEYYIPNLIKANPKASKAYCEAMTVVKDVYMELTELGIPREDLGNLVPLGQHTKVVLKINLRALLNMFEVRTCTRAYKEFRELMNEIKKSLAELDVDWEELMADYAKTKCDKLGYCNEKKSCGRYKTLGEKNRAVEIPEASSSNVRTLEYKPEHSVLNIPLMTSSVTRDDIIEMYRIDAQMASQTSMNLGEGI